MKPTKLPSILAWAALFSACATHSPTYRESAMDLGDRLVKQLEARKDLRSIRLYVDDFQPCHRGADSRLVAMNPSMAVRHEISARRLKHEIIGVLAPRLSVLESDGVERGSGSPDPGTEVKDASFAAALGASGRRASRHWATGLQERILLLSVSNACASDGVRGRHGSCRDKTGNAAGTAASPDGGQARHFLADSPAARAS